jgi:hypothetical protein
VRRSRTIAAVLGAVSALALAAGPTAGAKNPGRWVTTGASSIPVPYWQGLTSDPTDSNLFFIGVFQGLWRTTPQLHETAGVSAEIPQRVTDKEGYNHIGDPTWNPGDGGRVLLPMECFQPGVGNTCGTGAFGVADPATLAFRYYVKLDPAEIPKAMWAETSPDGSRIWTSSGNDLLAYRSSDVSRANRGGVHVIQAVRRLVGAVPPSGVTGAVFWKGKLLLAGEDHGAFQVWSVDTNTGARQLEVEKRICGESEGLDVITTLGGELHWLIAPAGGGCELTFGPTSALIHMIPRPGHLRLKVRVTDTKVGTIPGTVRATVRVKRDGYPLPGARVAFAGGHAQTGKLGLATVSTTLERPGRFRALARKDHDYGISGFKPVGIEKSAAHARARRSGAA